MVHSSPWPASSTDSNSSGSRGAAGDTAAAAAAAAGEALPHAAVPKPFTVPPGYVAPSIGEQFRYVRVRYIPRHILNSVLTPVSIHCCRLPACLPWPQAALKHPYSRYGYVAAVLVGALGWALASRQQQQEQRHVHGDGSDRGAVPEK